MSGSHVGSWVDVDLLVVSWLNANGGISPAEAVTVVPSTIPTGGLIWVATVGGPSDWSEAKIKIDLQFLVPGSFGAASDLAKAGHNAMAALGGQQVNGQQVHLVRCKSVPSRHPWSDTVDRLIGTYELDLPVL